ncbi:hypothetical protein E6W39_07050 [Kitasatospora acidiphila]|uniref:Spore-associated protein A n=1 Tax=Kitasatospora acidiphila TaxID=2567942 RepID=A0A540VZ95_9ACTN|nr:hypothetical protein [Kitasatospora acidiphila]TQF02085.1 hypothetical protein E6W39_07050 [Kitasatospora acidiphila]
MVRSVDARHTPYVVAENTDTDRAVPSPTSYLQKGTTMRARKAISSLVITGLTTLGMAVAAPAAHAGGYGCVGSETSASPLTVPDRYGNVAGYIHEYFDGTDNCAVFVKSQYYGTPTYMELTLYNASGPGKPDNGTYSYYAGPVKVNGVGSCVQELIVEDYPGSSYDVNYWTPQHSCG